MKIVVIGGTGLIGSRIVPQLTAAGHHAVAASRATGVNSFTTEGLADVLDGADSVVDVSNSSYTDEAGAAEFFETSTLNLLTFGAAAGVRHHVALSIVGLERLAISGYWYFRAKAIQETLIRESNRQFSIVHATQFFEFLRSIAAFATTAGEVRVAEALVQPMAADDVASALCSVALGEPRNGIVEFAGPEKGMLRDFVRRDLLAIDDPRSVTADPLGRYFGGTLHADDLLPAADATLADTHFDEWVGSGVHVGRAGAASH